MQEQHQHELHSPIAPPTVEGPQDEPARSPSPSPASSSTSSQTAAHAVGPPQVPSTTSRDTENGASLVQAPFAQHDFPVLTSAPAIQPGTGAKDDLDPQYPASTNVHMLGGRATYVLPANGHSAFTSASSLHMTTASGGAASLAQQHGADRLQQPTYSWYDPGAPQNPLVQHAQPRSAPAQQLSFSTGHLDSASAQGERRTSNTSTDQAMGNPHAGGSGGSKAGQAQPASSGPRTPEMDRVVAMAGRKRSRDEQPDIVVDSSSAAGAGTSAPSHLSVGVSVRLSSGEMHDASSATTDDEAVEVQQREAQRRRIESNAHQQQQLQALAYQQQQAYYAQQQQLYYQQQQYLQRGAFNAYGASAQAVSAGGDSGARTHPQQQYLSAPAPHGRQLYQGTYSGYSAQSAQSSAQSGEASSSSSGSASPPLANAQPQRFAYYPPAGQSYYAPSYAHSTSTSHNAYSPSTAITSPSVQATPGPSDRRSSGPPPPLLPAFGAAPPQQQQKQAFGAASSAQGAQAATADESEEKPAKRRVQVQNPFVIPTAPRVKPFVNKLRFMMLNPDKVGDVICWDESGKVVLVHTTNERLEAEVLPRTFGHSNFNSLHNQFRSYGFVALKEPALSRALNPDASSSSSTDAADAVATASTSAAPSSSLDEPRDVREWKAFMHIHSAADLAAMRAEEREHDAVAREARRAARAKEAAKRAKAAEKSKGEGVSGAAAHQVEESSSEEEEEDSEEDEDDGEPWFSRDEIDNLRLLRRLRPKSSKQKGKAVGGGAAASGSGGGGGGGAARTAAGSSSAGSSTALGSNIAQSQPQQLQYIAPRTTSTAAPSSASTKLVFVPHPAVPPHSSAPAIPPFKATLSSAPPPHVHSQAQALAQGDARDPGSADRVDIGSLVGLRVSRGAGSSV